MISRYQAIMDRAKGKGCVRKVPCQVRSWDTVNAIIGATLDLKTKYAAADITSDMIAVRVGISIGSFYQFFPSREAVLIVSAEAHILDTEFRGSVVDRLHTISDNMSSLKDLLVQDCYLIAALVEKSHAEELIPLNEWHDRVCLVLFGGRSPEYFQ